MVFDSEQPLEEQNVYVLRPNEDPLVLTPFCVARDCPECRRRELFYPDRLTDAGLRLKSLDEGHLLVDEEVSNELPAWGSDAQLKPAGNSSPVTLRPSRRQQPLDEGAEDVERKFHREMVRVYEEAKSEAGYVAARFLQLISELGGVGAARRLLHSSGVSEGFSALWERGRLDLTVEARVLKPEFETLFSEEERDIARKRLHDYGHTI